MLQQLVHPLVIDRHSPLLLLQLLSSWLAKRRRLLDRHVYNIRPECVHNLEEVLSVRHALVALADRVWQVLSDLWQLLHDLRVDILDCKLGPLRHCACRHISLQQDLLLVAQDLLDELQSCSLERRHQVTD